MKAILAIFTFVWLASFLEDASYTSRRDINEKIPADNSIETIIKSEDSYKKVNSPEFWAKEEKPVYKPKR